MHYDARELWDRFWRDDKDRIVVWQTPNAFLIAWAVFTVASLLTNAKLADIFSWISIVALMIWSVLEIWKGVNYLRRLLGLVVLVLTIFTIVHVF
jgi:hypothetical protein